MPGEMIDVSGHPLLGCEEPRLWTPPLRPLTRGTTHGYDVADFASEVVGEPLLPWERWLMVHALELLPDGTYRFRTVLALAARQNGKTHTKKILRLWKMFIGGAKTTLGVAQDIVTAKEVWQLCLDVIEATPALAAELVNVRRANGEIEFTLASGARYVIRAANRSAGRGLTIDDLDFEEVREQLTWDAWGALSKTTMARAHAQMWAISNAGDARSVVLNHLRSAAGVKMGPDGVSVLGESRDPSLGIFEWSAPEGCDLDDRAAWAQANPGLGHIISERAIASALTTDPPAVFRTEVLCQRVDALDTAIDEAAWKDLADTGNLESAKHIGLCFDVAPDGRHATLAAAAELPDGRVRIEAVAHWSGTDEARDALRGFVDLIKPLGIAWYPSGPAAALAPVFKSMERAGIVVIPLTGGAVNQACMGLSDLVDARRIVHPNDPLINTHVANSHRLNVGDGWRFVRRESGHVDAAYAVGGAVHVALTQEPPTPMPRAQVV